MGDRLGDFREFVRARSPALMRTAYLLTGDRQLAEDLLQTVLMRSYGRWSKLDNPEAYLRRSMVTTVISWRRRRWVGEIPTEQLPSPRAGDPAENLAVRADLLGLLRELGPRQRAVVVLRYYEDLSEAEVAQMLGISVGTVKSQAARALARLRESPALCALIEEGAR
jgi:RNA polymerase sigma-70 factor (sigma-E family)